jgi:hypothetical protein
MAMARAIAHIGLFPRKIMKSMRGWYFMRALYHVILSPMFIDLFVKITKKTVEAVVVALITMVHGY